MKPFFFKLIGPNGGRGQETSLRILQILKEINVGPMYKTEQKIENIFPK